MPQTPVGWYNNGHYDYYYYADGTKAIGLTWVGTKRYNFDKNGAMYKNAWTNSDKYSYYSTSDGSLAVGLTWVRNAIILIKWCHVQECLDKQR